MAPTGIAGENSPVWLSAGLVTIGLAGWLGAGASAHAEREAPVVRTQSPVPDAPPPKEHTPKGHTPKGHTPKGHTPKPDGETKSEGVAERPTQPNRIPEPCAPVVELQFAAGSSEVADAAALKEIVAAALRFGDRKVVVEGYASATGSPHRNLELSHRRAGRAKSKLVASGVAGKRVRVQAFGEYRPNLAGNTDQDRRVLIRPEGIPACPEQQGEE